LGRQGWWIAVLVVCGIILTWSGVGCNGGRKLSALVEVTGQVTLDGKPFSQGIVAFIPDGAKGTTGPIAGGNIDANGHYRIKTAGKDGAGVGWYTVTVESSNQGSLVENQPLAAIPGRYSNPETSTLKKEVKAGNKNVIDLELTSKP
jgi:hypothetical protein